MIEKKLKLVRLILLSLHLGGIIPVIAQERETVAPTAAAPSGEIHGKIVFSVTGDAQGKHRRDPLQEMYSTHGIKSTDAAAGPAGAAQLRLSEKTVVYLESQELNGGRYAVPEKNPLLDQRDLKFHPQVLPILRGTTVDFPNRDNLFHNVFSYSSAKRFDLGRYPKNDSRSITFDLPGIVRVYCDIHSHMNATILVLENPYFAVPDDNGAYSLQHIPEGEHTVVLWHDRDVVERRTIQVRAGQSIEVDFER